MDNYEIQSLEMFAYCEMVHEYLNSTSTFKLNKY